MSTASISVYTSVVPQPTYIRLVTNANTVFAITMTSDAIKILNTSIAPTDLSTTEYKPNTPNTARAKTMFPIAHITAVEESSLQLCVVR